MAQSTAVRLGCSKPLRFRKKKTFQLQQNLADQKEAAKKLMKEQKESMEKLLTEEQKKKFKEVRSNGPKGPMHRRGTQPPPPPSSEEDRKRPKQKV